MSLRNELSIRLMQKCIRSALKVNRGFKGNLSAHKRATMLRTVSLLLEGEAYELENNLKPTFFTEMEKLRHSQ